MIIKYFELKKKDISKFNYFLLYGNNKGLIEETLTKVIKPNITGNIYNYDEDEIVKNLGNFEEIISKKEVTLVLGNPRAYVEAFRKKKPKFEKMVRKDGVVRLQEWHDAVRKAMNSLGIQGTGLPKKGEPLYAKALEIYAHM